MTLPLLPTISTIFIVISAILVAIGWAKIKKNDIEGHKKVMVRAAIFAVAFFLYIPAELF